MEPFRWTQFLCSLAWAGSWNGKISFNIHKVERLLQFAKSCRSLAMMQGAWEIIRRMPENGFLLALKLTSFGWPDFHTKINWHVCLVTNSYNISSRRSRIWWFDWCWWCWLLYKRTRFFFVQPSSFVSRYLLRSIEFIFWWYDIIILINLQPSYTDTFR